MKNLWWHNMTSKEDGLRGYLTWHRPEHRDAKIGYQILWRKHKLVEPGFSIHLGDRHSETPVDLMFSLFGLASYFNLAAPGLGKFCEFVGRGRKRNVSLKVHNGMLWWELWYFGDHGSNEYHSCDSWRRPKLWPWSMGRDKHRPWMCLRHGNIDINPIDAFFGSKSYSYEDLEQKTLIVPIDQFPGDTYEVDFTLQSQTLSRRHGPKWVRGVKDMGLIADWDCKNGIPTQNHDWKGNNTYGCAVKIDGRDLWQTQAVNNLIDWVCQERARRNYRHEESEVADGGSEG